MKLATIDIGTNTTLLLIAERDAHGNVTPLVERAEITRLGRGIGKDGGLHPDSVARSLEVLRQYAGEAAAHGAPIAAIGTEALRRAPNANDFVQPAEHILGAPVEIITGDREAELTFLAAVRSFPRETNGACLVIDIGGGSTEFILSEAGNIRFARSLPLGSVRLTEAFIHQDPPSAHQAEELRTFIAGQLAPVPSLPNLTLVGCAGTVTTVAAMAQDLETYDPARVHGYRLSQAALQAQVARLAAATQAEREQMKGLDPRRADVIFAGATLLLEIMRHARVADVLVSDRGIRWGLLFDRLAAAR